MPQNTKSGNIPIPVDRSGESIGRRPGISALYIERLLNWLKTPRPYLMIMGIASVFGFWYMAVDVLALPRFNKLPKLATVIEIWVSRTPAYGLSIYTADYYRNIWASLARVLIAFGLATCVGVPLGLMLGWSKKFKAYVFPVFELLRPVPALAWVPLAIVMFSSYESPILFLTFLPAFFATTLNTMLGVRSIDATYVQAAYCLGARNWQIFRHIVIPGSMPFIFTGLQISMGVAWFSLVAGEMIAGDYGLGYVIYNAYTLLAYPNIIIGMITLGVVGYFSSAVVRVLGNFLMKWRIRELGV